MSFKIVSEIRLSLPLVDDGLELRPLRFVIPVSLSDLCISLELRDIALFSRTCRVNRRIPTCLCFGINGISLDRCNLRFSKRFYLPLSISYVFESK
jgi:hypothetical protein